MVTAWAFIFGCVLCLMFLGMIYGERVSLPGSFDGRWLSRGFSGAGRVWDDLARAVDLMLQFVSDHLSWVVAAVSGAAGLFVVAFQMFSGIADDAVSAHRDLKLPLHAGGVIDVVPRVTGDQELAQETLAGASGRQPDASQFLLQQPGGTFVVFNKPDRMFPPRQPDPDDLAVPVEFPVRGVRRPRGMDGPTLTVKFDRFASPGRSSAADDSISVGELIRDLPEAGLIDRALRSLGRDAWRVASFDSRSSNEFSERSSRTLPEASSGEIRDLEAAVRVLPGDLVAEHDLRVEKFFPRESDGAEIAVEILIQNVGITRVSGLLVREFLPPGYLAIRRTVPLAALRHDTLTWLIDDLRPLEERVLSFTVVTDAPGGSGRRGSVFESTTEVSAATAVSSLTVVSSDEPMLSPDFEREPRPLRGRIPAPIEPDRPLFEDSERSGLPKAARRSRVLRPDVRVQIEEPQDVVAVDTDTTVRFIVSNHGDAAAEDVQLQVDLDLGIWHHRIGNDNSQRTVVNSVKRLEPGESRTVLLSVRPTRPGLYRSTGSTMFQGERISSDTFRIVAEEPGLRNPTKRDSDPALLR